MHVNGMANQIVWLRLFDVKTDTTKLKFSYKTSILFTFNHLSS